MSETYKCPKGMLVALDENGNYVPFLMQVRDKDIIWDLHNVSEDISVIAYQSNSEKSDFVIPQPHYSIYANGWMIKLSQDYSFTAFKEIHLNDRRLHFSNVDDNTVESCISIPVKAERDYINIQATVNTKSQSMKYIIPSVNVVDTESNKISKFILSLTNVKDKIELDRDSSIMISITGKAVR